MQHLRSFSKFPQVKLNTKATAVDTKAKTVSLDCDVDVEFDKLFLATGCSSMNPAPQLYNGSNLYEIRSEADAAAFVGALEYNTFSGCG